ncbi:MAG: acyl-CoA thioesterase [Planctomycetales bacterium]|nr:acyl-CoA thioesterase [Planctomycetales bacterium]
MPAREPVIRVIMMPRDTNAAGTIFGGVILSYVDQAAAVEAHRQNPRRKFVTVAMKEVVFKQPVRVGDLLTLYTRTDRIGTTSVSIHVDVEVYRPGSQEKIPVTEADVVFVAVDDQGRPVPVREGA